MPSGDRTRFGNVVLEHRGGLSKQVMKAQCVAQTFATFQCSCPEISVCSPAVQRHQNQVQNIFSRVWWRMPSVSAESSLVYNVSSRTARITQKNPVLKNESKQQSIFVSPKGISLPSRHHCSLAQVSTNPFPVPVGLPIFFTFHINRII